MNNVSYSDKILEFFKNICSLVSASSDSFGSGRDKTDATYRWLLSGLCDLLIDREPCLSVGKYKDGKKKTFISFYNKYDNYHNWFKIKFFDNKIKINMTWRIFGFNYDVDAYGPITLTFNDFIEETTLHNAYESLNDAQKCILALNGVSV